MLPNKIKYTIAIGILLLSVLFFYISCKKECIQCKTQFRTYQMYKGSDTIHVESSGRDEDILDSARQLRANEGFIFIKVLNDSLFYENFCGTKDINNLKKDPNAKSYCYPI